MFRRGKGNAGKEEVPLVEGWTDSLFEAFLGVRSEGMPTSLTVHFRRLERRIENHAIMAGRAGPVARTALVGLTPLWAGNQRASVCTVLTFEYERWGRAQDLAPTDIGYLRLDERSEMSGARTPIIRIALYVESSIERELVRMLIEGKIFVSSFLTLHFHVQCELLVARTPAEASAFFLERQLPISTLSAQQILDLAGADDSDELYSR